MLLKMGTPLKPLKLLLSPKLSPMPTLRTPTYSRTLSVSPIPLISPFELKKRFEYNVKITPRKATTKTEIKFNLKACSPIKKNRKRLLLVTSPVKNILLKEGLVSQTKLNILGRGSFGTVVRGSFKGQNVALKITKTKGSINEINALPLNHENVVRTLDVIVKNELHAIVIMEYLPHAQQLLSLINNEEFDLDLQLSIKYTIDITLALSYCHGKQVLHLDIKPTNVLVTKNLCKICDFGNSRIINKSECKYEGTAHYAAPEILSGNAATFASDIYSLGVVMWQLRSRENPYVDLDCRDQIIYNVVKHELRPHATLGCDVDDDFAKLYRLCWQTEESSRPPLTAIRSALLRMQLL